MNVNEAKREYRKQFISTASPAEIEIMLLQESILSLKKAKAARGHFERNDFFQKAQQYLLEIIPFINQEIKEGEAAVHAYLHVNNLLIEANIEKNEQSCEEALLLLHELLYAWKESILK
ncbi:flagellar protein FliS [Domibacillus indicus]|uniref:flagellar protein FliS n=1 Tax=Domibacillus indicus TaxID=1437523 RepID=UPI00061802DB|nr:flagellar protein FliS [Domibacillus indicus]